MNIKINSVEYKEYWNGCGITVNVDFIINDIINSNITIHDERRLDIGEIIDYIRKMMIING